MAQTAESETAFAYLPQVWRVINKRRESADTWTLRFASRDGSVETFAPGQFNMLYAFSVGEIAVSISGDAKERTCLVHTIRSVGPISAALCHLSPGQELGVRGPYGTAWPLEEAVGHDIFLVAGGLGLAPLRPAICHLLRSRHNYGRVVVLCGAQTPDGLLYRAENTRWRRGGIDVQRTVNHGALTWDGNVGLVTTLLERAEVRSDKTTALVCGPEPMMRAVAKMFIQCGVPTKSIFLSLERNMKCAVGWCGHCQLGPYMACKGGPILSYDRLLPWIDVPHM